MQNKITDCLDINLGLRCNQRCAFCYYLGKREQPNKTVAQVKRELDRCHRMGIRKLHITGGEPLLHDGLGEIVAYARRAGFTHQAIITNGTGLHKSRLHDLRMRGADEFGVSLHGATEGTHNSLVGRAYFDRTLAAISLLRDQGCAFAVNFVVTSRNCTEMRGFAELISPYSPRLVTFLFFNNLLDASQDTTKLVPDPTIAIPCMESAGEILEASGVCWDYKFVPMCSSVRTIRHCNNLPQAMYDFEEWNYQVRLVREEGWQAYLLSLVNSYRDFSRAQLRSIPFRVLSYLSALRYTNRYSLVFLPECEGCRYRFVCSGVNRDYLEQFSSQKMVTPQPGVPEVDPVVSRGFASPPATRWDVVANETLYRLSCMLSPKTTRT